MKGCPVWGLVLSLGVFRLSVLCCVDANIQELGAGTHQISVGCAVGEGGMQGLNSLSRAAIAPLNLTKCIALFVTGHFCQGLGRFQEQARGLG